MVSFEIKMTLQELIPQTRNAPIDEPAAHLRFWPPTAHLPTIHLIFQPPTFQEVGFQAEFHTRKFCTQFNVIL